MLKKLKELLGFPTEQEKAAAKEEVKVEPTTSDNVFPFPKSDKPEAVVEAKPKAKRTPKAKTEPTAKEPAKKPATKRAGTPKAPAVKKPAVKKPRQTKAV